MSTAFIKRYTLIGILLVLAGCEGAETAVAPPIRSVKTIEIAEWAGQQERRLAGIVEAQTVSELAFEVSGRVVILAHDIGERVSAGEIIARLDRQPYELRIKASEASLTEAQARRRDAQSKFTQQSTLFEKGFATKTALDTAQANLESTSSLVAAAQADLDLAKRDLNKTELRSPFTGTIGERYVDPFSEVSSGQRIYQVNTEGKNEIQVSVPESLLQNISIGDQTEIDFPTIEGLKATGKVTEIGSRANTANAFPLTVALDEQPTSLRPGMSAQVTFSFGSEATETAFLLPITAAIAQPEETVAAVFVFHEDKGTVERRSVRVTNVIGNDLEVIGNLNPGEKIVVGGVSFLSDGMTVRAMTGKVR